MSTFEEKQGMLHESLKMLASHEPFLRFMDAIEAMRESSITDACRMDVVENPGKISAALGEVRCYTDIKAIVAEYRQKQFD